MTNHSTKCPISPCQVTPHHVTSHHTYLHVQKCYVISQNLTSYHAKMSCSTPFFISAEFKCFISPLSILTPQTPSPSLIRVCLRSTRCRTTPPPLLRPDSSESYLPTASRSVWSESTSSRLKDCSPKTPTGRYECRGESEREIDGRVSECYFHLPI